MGFCFCLLALLVGCTNRPPAPKVFLLDANKLAESRAHLRSGDASLRPALQKLQDSADAAMTAGPFTIVDKSQLPPGGDKHDYLSLAPYWWPDPKTPDGLPYIRRDGERNPEIKQITDHAQLSRMIDTVQTLSLAYYFSGDERYAARAAELLRVFYLDRETRMNPHLEFAQAIRGVNTGRGIGIIETSQMVHVCDAVGLLAGSKSWTKQHQRGVEDWFAAYLKWLRESDHGKSESNEKNNHGTHYDVQVVTYALFLNKRGLAKEMIDQVPAKRIAVQIEPDGRQPLELARTKAWSYSVMNLRGLMELCVLGRAVGVDLWNYATPAGGRSVPRALKFLEPYALGEAKWPYPQINGFRPEGAHYLLRWAMHSPPSDPANLDNLTGPRLIANPLDSN